MCTSNGRRMWRRRGRLGRRLGGMQTASMNQLGIKMLRHGVTAACIARQALEERKGGLAWPAVGSDGAFGCRYSVSCTKPLPPTRG